MTTYSLNIDIDDGDLSAILNAGQRVTLVKSVGSSPSNVAWVSFQPFKSNTVTWTANYVIYGTPASIRPGTAIAMTSRTGVAREGVLYTFTEGQFTPAPGGAPGWYGVQNNQANGISFGLAQQARINGTAALAPLNAVPVLMNEQAMFQVVERVSVCLTSFENNGVVISSVAGNALAVALTSANPSAALAFHDATNSFYLSGTGSTVTHADLALRPGSGRRPQLQRFGTLPE